MATDNSPKIEQRPPWPYRADRPQRFGANYARYLARGGLVRPEEDVQGFVAGGENYGDMGRFFFFCMAFDQILKEGVVGDLAELGVYKGYTATLLATIARRLGRTAYLLDTFEGFTASDLHGVDTGARSGSFGDTSLEAVRALVGNENVCFIKGYFPDTAAQIPGQRKFCLVHIDCDLYLPMKSALDYFYPRLSPGGFLIVHDYSSLHWDGAEKAIDEFFSDKSESVVPLTDGAGSAVIRKARTASYESNWLLNKGLSLLGEDWVEAGNGRIAEILGAGGWARPESWGVWGVGEAHQLHLVLPRMPSGTVELQVDVHVILLGSRTSQQVDVFVAGQRRKIWNFTQDSNRGVRRVQISVPDHPPSELLSVGIEFKPRSIARPCDLDSSVEDGRILGLALHRIRIIRNGGALASTNK